MNGLNDPGTPVVLRKHADDLDQGATHAEREAAGLFVVAASKQRSAEVWTVTAEAKRAQAADLRHLAAEAERALRTDVLAPALNAGLPHIWSGDAAPGGEVCAVQVAEDAQGIPHPHFNLGGVGVRICGEPVETRPCQRHAPGAEPGDTVLTATAEPEVPDAAERGRTLIAVDVFAVLKHVLGHKVHPEAVVTAAARLADMVQEELGDHISGADVRRDWPEPVAPYELDSDGGVDLGEDDRHLRLWRSTFPSNSVGVRTYDDHTVFVPLEQLKRAVAAFDTPSESGEVSR